MKFTASENPAERLALSTSNIDMTVSGDFSYSMVYNDLISLAKEYMLNFQNNFEDIEAYYAQKSANDDTRYKLNYAMTLRDMNPFINVFLDDPDSIGISKNAVLDGMILGGQTRVFNLYAEADSVSINGQHFLQNTLEFNSSKIADSANVLASLYIQSDEQVFRNFTETKGLFAGGVWNRDRINFEFNISQKQLNNYAFIRGDIMFLQDTIQANLRPDSIGAFDQNWEIAPQNKIQVVFNDFGYESFFHSFEPIHRE